jgi:polyphosphate kinase 2
MLEKKTYQKDLRALQVELVKFQRHVIADHVGVLVILEGRDAAGKGGVIKRVTAHLSPRETRVVALGAPSDRERRSWYFQRYVAELPALGEIVLFNRSWYNRAGVERVMGFCTDEEYQLFMETVQDFEHNLSRNNILLVKYYLDISRDEQRARLDARRLDPLKQWKVSAVDEQAQANWGAYSAARDSMLAATHRSFAPWTAIRTDDKRAARLNLIRDLLSRLDYEGRDDALCVPDPSVVISYDRVANGEERLAE